jgi:hypothetical protein
VQGPLWEYASLVPVRRAERRRRTGHDRSDSHPRPRCTAGELHDPRRDAAGEHPLRGRRIQPRAVPPGAPDSARRSTRPSPRPAEGGGDRPRGPAADRRRRRRPGHRGDRRRRPR